MNPLTPETKTFVATISFSLGFLLGIGCCDDDHGGSMHGYIGGGGGGGVCIVPDGPGEEGAFTLFPLLPLLRYFLFRKFENFKQKIY